MIPTAEPWKPRPGYLLNADGCLNSGSSRVHRRRIGDGARLASPAERNTKTQIKRGVVERRVELLESGFLDRNDGGVGDERRLHLVRCGSFGGVDRFHGAHADDVRWAHGRRGRRSGG